MDFLQSLQALGQGASQVQEEPKTKVEAMKTVLTGGTDTIVETIPKPATRAKMEEAGAGPAEPATEPKKKRGRPKKMETITIEDEQVETTTEWSDPPAKPTPAPPPDPAPEPKKEVDVGKINFLFIDCVPTCGLSVGAIRFGQWLTPVLEAIRKHTGVDWGFHEFGKAKAILVQFARRAPLPAAMIVDSGSPEATVLWEYLISKSYEGMIVQGVQ